MGQCYSFVCNDCKKMYGLDKLDNARCYLKSLLEKHQNHDIEISDHSESLDEKEMYRGYKKYFLYDVDDERESELGLEEFFEIVDPLIEKYLQHFIDYEKSMSE